MAVYGDRVYVSDRVADRIQVFDLDGNYILGWGQSGAGAGMFDEAWYVDVDVDGYVYVTDRGNHRIQKFTRDGEFLVVLDPVTTEMPASSYPTGIAVLQQDMVYVVSGLLNSVMEFIPPAYGGGD